MDIKNLLYTTALTGLSFLGITGCQTATEQACDPIHPTTSPSPNTYEEIKERADKQLQPDDTRSDSTETYRAIREEVREQTVKQQLGNDFSTAKDSLYREVRQQLEDQEHTARLIHGSFYNEQLPHPDSLTTTELNVITTILDGLQQQATANRIGQLIQKDMQDTYVALCGVDEHGNQGWYVVNAGKTELGGEIKQHDDKLQFPTYEPATTSSNFEYLFPYDNPHDRSLASYHLHAALDDRNNLYAGPSITDIRYTVAYNHADVVFTHLQSKKESDKTELLFNADITTPSGNVIDLGNYTAHLDASTPPDALPRYQPLR